MHGRIEEILSFLSHHDFSLARRRMLDLSLDTGEIGLIRDVIHWSSSYARLHPAGHVEQAEAPEAFITEGKVLLDRMARYEPGLSGEPQTLLVASNISKKYQKGHFSLMPVSIEVASGSVSGIVGENGNGKTTLLRCLAGQLAHDTGTITYTQLAHPDGYSIKAHVAFIPQRIPGWHGLLKDNLSFSAALSGLKGAENDLMVQYMLERLHLGPYAGLSWNQLSSGYRTRFEIARVLLQHPSLLILDEPLANLDINAQQTLLADLQYLARSARRPMGILLSSQQLHEVEKIADTVYFIKAGTCTSNKTNAALITTSMVEIETTASREALENVFDTKEVTIQFNGNYYTLSSAVLPATDLLTGLLQNGTPVFYFRDITHSAKRFF